MVSADGRCGATPVGTRRRRYRTATLRRRQRPLPDDTTPDADPRRIQHLQKRPYRRWHRLYGGSGGPGRRWPPLAPAVLALLVVVASLARAAHSAKDVPVYHVRAVSGRQARLPCDVSAAIAEEEDGNVGAGIEEDDGGAGAGNDDDDGGGDAALLLLWYRDDLGTPIYSVDARVVAARGAGQTRMRHQQAQHQLLGGPEAERWSDPHVLGDRARFRVNDDATAGGLRSSELRIDRVRPEDGNGRMYRCRVDFQRAQTRNSMVNLTIIVPPDRLEVLDLQAGGRVLLETGGGQEGVTKTGTTVEGTGTSEADGATAVAGPYAEGDRMRLRCRARGGKPNPIVEWYRDGRRIQELQSSSSNGDFTETDLDVSSLGRSDLHAELVCRAHEGGENTGEGGDSAELTAVVHVDMNFPPLTVDILMDVGDGSGIDGTILETDTGVQMVPVTAGRRYEVPCRSTGSRPPAELTWWLDGRRLDNAARETTSADGNTTTSVLTLVPEKPTGQVNVSDSAAPDGVLTCRAENRHATAAISGTGAVPFIQASRALRIQYAPVARIELGAGLRADNVREGADVYFDCLVDARPPARRVLWTRDGTELKHDAARGTVVSNQSLALQGVGRRQTGHYSCAAVNAEGTGRSQALYLDVQYAPSCSADATRVYGVGKRERVRIGCRVDANPAPVEYRWSFNNTAMGVQQQSQQQRQHYHDGFVPAAGGNGTTAGRWLDYAPHTDTDYGTVSCWARNNIGNNKASPCVYHVIAAGRPDRPTNCTVVEAATAPDGVHSSSASAVTAADGEQEPGAHTSAAVSFRVRCAEGYDGGMPPQRFWAEVRDADGGEVRANVSGLYFDDDVDDGDPAAGRLPTTRKRQRPVFDVIIRSAASLYRVDVIASNAKGRADPVTLLVTPPGGGGGRESQRPAVERPGNLLDEQGDDLDIGIGGRPPYQMTPAVAAAAAAVTCCALVAAVCAGATYLRYQCRGDDGSPSRVPTGATMTAGGTTVAAVAAADKTADDPLTTIPRRQHQILHHHNHYQTAAAATVVMVPPPAQGHRDGNSTHRSAPTQSLTAASVLLSDPDRYRHCGDLPMATTADDPDIIPPPLLPDSTSISSVATVERSPVRQYQQHLHHHHHPMVLRQRPPPQRTHQRPYMGGTLQRPSSVTSTEASVDADVDVTGYPPPPVYYCTLPRRGYTTAVSTGGRWQAAPPMAAATMSVDPPWPPPPDMTSSTTDGTSTPPAAAVVHTNGCKNKLESAV